MFTMSSQINTEMNNNKYAASLRKSPKKTQDNSFFGELLLFVQPKTGHFQTEQY